MRHLADGAAGKELNDGVLPAAFPVGELQADVGQAMGLDAGFRVIEVHPVALDALVHGFMTGLPDSFQRVALVRQQFGFPVIALQNRGGDFVPGDLPLDFGQVVIVRHQEQGVVPVLAERVAAVAVAMTVHGGQLVVAVGALRRNMAGVDDADVY